MESHAPIRVLHLMGSPTSSFYFDLSVMYGRTCFECADLDRNHFVHQVAIVYTSGRWSFPATSDKEAMTKAEQESVSFAEAMAQIGAQQPPIDVVLPHMFCLEGLTRYRILADLLGVELLGCSGETNAVAEDKFLTKALCKVSGVPVPEGELLRSDVHGKDVAKEAKQLLDRHSVPFIVKPVKEGNSFGLSLVKTTSPEEVAKALSEAFKYDDHILIEEYIAGREVRVAVLEVEEPDGVRLEILPKLEYVVDDVRMMKHKLGTDTDGKLGETVDAVFTKAKQESVRICPAQLEPEVHERIDKLAKNAHKALGFIVSLAAQSASPNLQPHPKVFESLLRRAAQETRSRRAGLSCHKKEPLGALKKRRITYLE